MGRDGIWREKGIYYLRHRGLNIINVVVVVCQSDFC